MEIRLSPLKSPESSLIPLPNSYLPIPMANKVFQTQVNDDSLAKKETMEAGIQTDIFLAKRD